MDPINDRQLEKNRCFILRYGDSVLVEPDFKYCEICGEMLLDDETDVCKECDLC